MKLHSIFSHTAAALALSALLLSGCGSSRYHDPDLTAAFAAQETTQEAAQGTAQEAAQGTAQGAAQGAAQETSHGPGANIPAVPETSPEADSPANPEASSGPDSPGPEIPAEAEPQPVRLLFSGDIYLSDHVLNAYDRAGDISGVLDDGYRSLIGEADYFAANQEFPFSSRGQQAPDKQYTFRVNPSYVTALQEMGVDVAGLANNHVLDYGTEALEDTFTTLENAGIAYTGAGRSYEDACRLIRFEKNGKSFGFLAASRVIPEVSWNVENGAPGVFCTYDITHLVEEIKKAKQQCDYVFVAVHWGVEHTDELTDYQPVIAHQLIDAGADGVIGSHPHVLQGMEFYQGKPIFYSLGNFIFNREIGRTAAVEITVTPENEMRIRLVPASAENAYTHSVAGEEAQAIFRYMDDLSGTATVDENGMVTPAL